jgi:hypothetical protein
LFFFPFFFPCFGLVYFFASAPFAGVMSVAWKQVYKESIVPWNGRPYGMICKKSVAVGSAEVRVAAHWPYVVVHEEFGASFSVWDMSLLRLVATHEIPPNLTLQKALLINKRIFALLCSTSLVIYDTEFKKVTLSHDIGDDLVNVHLSASDNGFVLLVRPDPRRESASLLEVIDVLRPDCTTHFTSLELSVLYQHDCIVAHADVNASLTMLFVGGRRPEDPAKVSEVINVKKNSQLTSIGFLESMVEDALWRASENVMYIMPWFDVIRAYRNDGEEPVDTINNNSMMRDYARRSAFYAKNIGMIFDSRRVGWNIDDDALWSISLAGSLPGGIDCHQFWKIRPFGTVYVVTETAATTEITRGYVTAYFDGIEERYPLPDDEDDEY